MPAAITGVRCAILRLDPSGGTLTSTHLVFLDLCLQTRSFREALPILEKVTHSLPATKNTAARIDGPFPCAQHTDSSCYINEASNLSEKLNVSDVHEYYLSGAMIYLGLRKWEDAMCYLEYVLTSPTQGTPTGLQLEAYQKWLLVSCLVRGRVSDNGSSYYI
jgi:COP9 signalosome complex subunit 3